MACCKKAAQPEKSAKKLTANERYLNAMFTMLKKRESVVVTGKSNKFNDTELRLIGEILSAKCENRRLISTQLATLLGVTRSAISQIVNRLEERGVVRRVDDDVDRKIAYIEVTDETLAQYQTELKLCTDFAGKVVKDYGVEKFETLCKLFEEFIETVEKERAEICAKKAK
ncbi:MAG: MarR family transcriptional regulator [Clostridia bacterium]|nr:MarR family transcriptional regulator [Clostridia bacterium]